MDAIAAPCQLHLSRLIPNLRSDSVRRDLANPYEMHRTLMRAFASAEDGGPGRVLWRREALLRGSLPAVLVQSIDAPAWERLPSDWLCSSLRPAGEIAAVCESKPWKPAFSASQLLRFRLRANPTKRLSARSTGPDGKPVDSAWVGKRVEIVDPEQQVQWLARHGGDGGFRLAQVRAASPPPSPVFAVTDAVDGKTMSMKRAYGATMRITHLSVLFEGLLEVTDPQRFADKVARGIGPAKAFGFGLLSLGPAR